MSTTDTYFLEVSVIEARNLAAKDPWGTSDPFVTLKLEKQRFKTKVIDRSLNPKWNETFSMPVIHPDNAELKLTCWDKDRIGKDFMGYITIPVASIRKQANLTLNDWFPLKTNEKNEIVSGDILLKVVFKEITRATLTEEEEKKLKKFHKRFPDIPSEENVIRAFQAGSFLSGAVTQGVIYCSDHYLCWYSNILGKKTKLKYKWTDVKSVDKSNTMLLVPDSIKIAMNDGKEHTFSGLIHRKEAYRLFKALLRQNQPTPTTPRKGKRGSSNSNEDSPSTGRNTEQTKMIIKVNHDGKTVELEVDITLRIRALLPKISSALGITRDELELYELCWKKKSKKVKLDESRSLASYDVPEKATILLTKPEHKKVVSTDAVPLPFKTFEEKFKINDSRSFDEISFEFAAHCLLYPLGIDFAPSESTTALSLQILKNDLNVQPHAFEEIMARVNQNGPGLESKLVEQEYRYKNMDKNQFYNKQTFQTEAVYKAWRQKEKQAITEIVEKLVFNNKEFYAKIDVKVIEATDLEAKDISGTSDPYVILNCEGQKAKTRIKKKTLAPVWNENFEFFLTSAHSTLNLSMFDWDKVSGDDFMSSLSINLHELRYKPESKIWYNLQPKGRLCLEYKFEFLYSKYVYMLNTEPTPSGIPVDHITSYSRLSKVLILNSEISKGAPLKNSRRHRRKPSESNTNTSNSNTNSFSSLSDLESAEDSTDTSSSSKKPHKSVSKTSIQESAFSLRGSFSDNTANDSNTLSTENVTWLLEEYAIRYGVGPVYCKLEWLNTLSAIMEPKIDHLEAIEEAVTDMYRLSRQYTASKSVRDNNNEPEDILMGLTTRERELYAKVEDQLMIHISSMLTTYLQTFPKNSPHGCVSTLVEILSVLRQFNHDEVCKELLGWIQECANNNYQTIRQKSRAQDQTEPFTVSQFMQMLDMLEDTVNNDVLYSESFPRDLDHVGVVVQLYIDRLQADLTQYLEKETSTEAFDIYFRLDKLLPTLIGRARRPATEFKTIPLVDLFTPVVYQWLKDTAQKLDQWIDNACKIDRRESVSIDELHSSSVVDIFSAAFQAHEFLRSLHLNNPFIIIAFAEVVCKSAKDYALRQYNDILKTLNINPTKTGLMKHSILSSRDASAHSPEEVFKIQKMHCIALNNIDNSRTQLDQLASEIEQDMSDIKSTPFYESCNATFQKCVEDTFKEIKVLREQLIEKFYSKMNGFIKSHLLQTISVKNSNSDIDTNKLNSLLDYLDEQLTTMSDCLYPHLFKIVPKSIWSNIVKDIKEMIFPHSSSSEPADIKSVLSNQNVVMMEVKQAKALVHNFEQLREYFYADGKGVPKEILDEQTGILYKMLELYEMATRDVIVLYVKKQKKEKKDDDKPDEPTPKMRKRKQKRDIDSNFLDIDAVHLLRILEGRKSDKLAQAFLKELQDPEVREKVNAVRTQFLLPQSDIILDEYKMTHGTTVGTLVVSSTYVLFDALFSKTADSEDQVAILLTDITKIKREKFALFMEAVVITDESGNVTKFSTPKNCEEIIADIITAAKDAGNSQIERDDKS